MLFESNEIPSLYLLPELVKLVTISPTLLPSPGRSEGGSLEAPVRCKDVIEEEETITSSPHLIDLNHIPAMLMLLVAACRLTWEFLVNPKPTNLSSKAGVFPRET